MLDAFEVAELAEAAAQYQSALEDAEVALSQTCKAGNMAAAARSHKLLGDIAAHQGKPVVARAHYAAALGVVRQGLELSDFEQTWQEISDERPPEWRANC